jgi:hypothetical protein
MSQIITRRALYEQVWAEPLQTLAKRFGFSDVALAKACRKADIPLPGLGYWAKRAAGKALPQPPLPPRGFGKSDEIHFGRDRYGYSHFTDEEVLNSPDPSPPSFSESMDDVIARATSIVGVVKARASLQRSHPLVEKLLQEDVDRQRKQQESKWPVFDKPLFDSPAGRRRLRIVNSIFLALSRCGYPPFIRDSEARELGVRVGDVPVSFTLETITSRRTADKQNAKHPLSKLKLAITWPQMEEDGGGVWQDNERQIEDHVQDIAVSLLVAAERLYRVHVIQNYQWQLDRKRELEEEIRREREEALRKERERLEAIERARRKKLLDQVAAWCSANELRAYVDAVVQARKTDDPQKAAELTNWAKWALGEADKIDPLSTETG